MFDVDRADISPNGRIYTKVVKIIDEDKLNVRLYITNQPIIREVKTLLCLSYNKFVGCKPLIDALLDENDYLVGILTDIIETDASTSSSLSSQVSPFNERSAFEAEHSEDEGSKYNEDTYVEERSRKRRKRDIEIIILIDSILIENRMPSLYDEFINYVDSFYMNPLRHCNGNTKDSQNLPIDPILFESIPAGEEIEIGDICYHENTIRELVNSNNLVDPFTRKPLPQSLINKYLVVAPKDIVINGITYDISDGILNLRSSGIENLDDIVQYAPFIEELDVSGNSSFYDLSKLRYFNKLLELDISDTFVRNIDPIRELHHLGILIVSQCLDLKNFDPILSCHRLMYLDISGTNLSEGLDFIKNCRSLETLFLINCDIYDISFIEDLRLLKRLDLSSNVAIENIDKLVVCSNMRNLELNETYIENIEFVRNMDSLRELDIGRTSVKDLSPIQDKRIKKLNISYSEVESLDILRNLKHLTYLDISGLKNLDVNLILECETLKTVIMTDTDIDRHMEILMMPNMEKIVTSDGVEMFSQSVALNAAIRNGNVATDRGGNNWWGAVEEDESAEQSEDEQNEDLDISGDGLEVQHYRDIFDPTERSEDERSADRSADRSEQREGQREDERSEDDEGFDLTSNLDIFDEGGTFYNVDEVDSNYPVN